MKTVLAWVLGSIAMTAAVYVLPPPVAYPTVRMPHLQQEPVLVAVRQRARDDKYKDDPHAACVTPAVAEYSKNPSLHPCTCTLMCAEGAGGYQEQTENPACELYCTKERCGCHPEENCDVPDVTRDPKDGR